MPTATIRDVELVSVGTWAASTGVTKVTRADLESMLAAHADGLVDHAPVKLGHVSPLNDDLGDGAPAYGWVTPTGIRPNAAGVDTLVGDLVGMPAALAEVAPTAYRRRSVEIAWQVTTAGGKTYPAALVGVALLGAAAPAVKGLADLVALYAEAPAAIGSTGAVEVVEGLEDNAVAVAMLTAARTAGASVETVDAMAAAAGAADTASIPPPITVPDDDDTTQTSTTPVSERTTMTDDEIRAALKLEADADVNAALAALLEERGTDPATAGTDPVAPTATPATPAAPVADAEPVGEPQLATLSAGTLAELQAEAEWARTTRRNGILDTAVREGRITPAERPAFLAQMVKDEAGTTTLLAAMAPRFAVTEFGHDAAPTADAAEKAYDDFDAEVFGLDRTPRA
jgi:hypothetical protein